ncbi:MAG TPA: hypothetical protein VEY71_07735 [Chitinophagales bacterium]|nr:hypothetical protein [Chitinophagales bacterium]
MFAPFLSRSIGFAVVIVVLISSCCDKSHYPQNVARIPPPPHAHLWYQFPEGFRIFENEAGELDTIVAEIEDTVYFPANPFPLEQEVWYSDCKTYELHGSLNGTFKLRTDTGLMRLAYLSTDGNYTELYISVGDYYFGDQRMLPSRDTSMTVNGAYFGDVNVIDSVMHHNGTPGTLITKAYYSVSKGFIKYHKPDGSVWELTN